MRRLAEIAVFLPVAAGLHAAAFGLAGGPVGGTGGAAGARGENLVTLAAASPQAAALVKEWQTPPEIPAAPRRATPPRAGAAPRLRVAAEPVPPKAPPVLGRTTKAMAPPGPPPPPVERPETFAGLVAPQMARDPAPVAPAMSPVAHPAPARHDPGMRPVAPDPDALAPPQPPAVAGTLARSPRPAPRPALPEIAVHNAAQPAPTAPAPAKRAAGAGGGAAAGRSAMTPEPGRQAALGASWAARIQARIARVHRVPRAVQRRGQGGRAVLRIVVARDGTLISVAVVQSAGTALLDRAAVQSVRRAGRLPAAPAGFADARMRFDVPLVFRLD